MKRIIMAACIVSLAACGGDKDDVATEQQQDWESQKQSLVYSFPDDNQQQVPVPSPVVLRFSGPVMETSPAVVLREVGGPAISEFETEWVDGKRGLIITPDSKLKPMTDYMVQIPAIELEKGMAPAKNIRFSTRALYEGPKSLVASDTFEVTRMIPDGENYQVMDFSSFRVQFSQPLDQTTVKYGDSADATVQLMGPEGVVDAHLLVSGHYMTVDPKEDLTPGAEYSLNMTTGITSTYGETLPGGSFGNPGDTLAVSVKVSPQDTKAPGTGLRVSMVQDVADTGELSPLTGMPINLVPMASVLLGEDTATQASGTIAAELAFVPNFPEATPFRVKRGSLIEGASIEVLIGGEVPAGFESGKVRMDFLSDATGYLLPNPYSNSDDAPRQVRLFMDVAVSTETPSANGAITQDLLHIELVGTSIVEDGVMVINAVGVVEPNVLGSERAKGVLSFYMKAFEDQDNVPALSMDNFGPEIQSWFPGPLIRDRYDAGSPIVVNFSGPIDPSTTNNGSISLLSEGQVISSDIKVDGSSVIIRPRNVSSGASGALPKDYEVQISQDVKGINGSPITSSLLGIIKEPFLNDSISIEEIVHNASGVPGAPNNVWLDVRRAPIVLSTFPGFPCVLEPEDADFENGIAGRCKGYFNGWNEGQAMDRRAADDSIPLPVHSGNYPIVVQFSKRADERSITERTFIVEEINEAMEVVSTVDGSIKVDSKTVRFWPEKPWEPGSYYRYTLKSNGDSASSTADCSGNHSICDYDGLPLQTVLWEMNTMQNLPVLGSPDIFDREFRHRHTPVGARSGGPDMVQYFKGGVSENNVIQVLAAPSADVNSNFYLDKTDVYRDQAMRDNGVFGQGYYHYRDFSYSPHLQENGADSQPLISDGEDSYPGALNQYDPGGVVPPINSAKVLSKETHEPLILQSAVDFYRTLLMGVNVGCGYSEQIVDHPEYDPQAGGKYVAENCPREKFSYINSAIVAEITDIHDAQKGIKVNIWPSIVMSTSLNMRMASWGVMQIPTGPQVMRMRYAKDDIDCIDTIENPCSRSEPITGWISEDDDGGAILKATVDMYLDAPEVIGNIIKGTKLADQQFGLDLFSYPVTMDLEGKVLFEDDGTMRIEQYNTNSIDIDFFLVIHGLETNEARLMIPEYGARLVFESEAIKR